MTVYVDDVKINSMGARMCYLWADTVYELRAMASTLSLPWRKVRYLRHQPHFFFDISFTDRARAIEAGAIVKEFER